MLFRSRRDDLDFMRDVDAAARRSGNRFAFILTLLSVAAVGALVVWADRAMLDEITRGDGRVVPSSRTQIIQNLEGGILAEIRVREGDIVRKGAVLVRIENTAARTTYRETRGRYLAVLARIARLEAELADRAIEFPGAVTRQAPALMTGERALFAARKSRVDTELRMASAQADQRRQEIAELRGRQTQAARTLNITREEHRITEPLVETGVMSRVTLLRLEREISTLEGDLEAVRLGVPRAKKALEEARHRRRAIAAAFRAEAQESLNRQRGELKSLEETMVAGKDRVTRTEVRSPVFGTVKDIKLSTIGGVIRPGEEIMEIVPLDDTLLVEAKIRPADIAFLRPDQPASVKITAYDYSIYGGLKSRVERISADTIEDERGDRFYRVHLRTETNALLHKGNRLPIIPGMTAAVEIQTGQKTVLDYLLKPVLKARERALRER